MRLGRCSLVLAVALFAPLLTAVSAGAVEVQPPASCAPSACPRVVVVGVAGLRWDDVGPATPVLRRLVGDAAVGALSVKALPAVSCRGDGWLTLGAGARAQHYGAEPPCEDRLPTDLSDQRSRNAASRDGADLGALADALAGSVSTVGEGAALAVLGTGVRSQAAVRVVDAGALPAGSGRRARSQEVDRRIGEALDALPATTDVLVVGVSEGRGGTEPHLQLALARGPSFPRGALTSASTRRAAHVQLIDVAPTVLALLNRPVPQTMDGQPWRVDGPAPSVAELVDLDRKAGAQRKVTVPFFVAVYAAVLLCLLLALWRRWGVVAELVALTGTAVLGASYLANLVPWWQAGAPLLALVAVVVPVAVGVAALALAVGSRGGSGAGPAGLACAFITAVLLGDLITGQGLQLSSVAGYTPLVAGRFAGIGNVAFGVLAAAALLATASLVRRTVLLLLAAGVTVAVDGAPPWGSDVGGVLALVPAFVVLVMLRTGRRITVTRLALAGLAGAAVVTGFALFDLSRPAGSRTHLGRFAADVVDGTAGELLRRKGEAVFALLFANPATALIPVVAAAVVYLVARPPVWLAHAFAVAPAWRHGLIAVGVAALIGFAVNDSGAAVVALALAVALPATAAVAIRASRCRASRPPGRGPAPVA